MTDQNKFDAYLKASHELEEHLRDSYGDELFEAKQHWVNNPLIKPLSKVAMFDKAIERAKKETEERIIALLDQKHTPHEGDQTHNESGECTACEVIAFIEGETE